MRHMCLRKAGLSIGALLLLGCEAGDFVPPAKLHAIVYGRVTWADGSPAVGVGVSAVADRHGQCPAPNLFDAFQESHNGVWMRTDSSGAYRLLPTLFSTERVQVTCVMVRAPVHGNFDSGATPSSSGPLRFSKQSAYPADSVRVDVVIPLQR